jgi:outer membrane protein assembly factor BamB
LKAQLDGDMAAVSPVVFAYSGRDLVVTAGKDGRINLLDSADLVKPLYRSAALGAVSGGLSSWLGMDGTRWVLVPVNGSVTAFKVEEQDGKTVLTRAWASRDLNSLQAPVIAGGVVFALATAGNRATLYALDGTTGKELYSSRNLVTAPASPTGMTVANGRVYFATTDGTLYAFGIYMEH